jgi:allantoinase
VGVPDDDLIIRSRRVVTPEGTRAAAVGVRDGRITAVLPYGQAASGADQVDLGEDALLPGLVDTHVHVNEPGRTEWEGFAHATRAAVAGGVTTLLDMPLNSVPPTVSAAALEVKRRAAAGQVHTDVGFWGGAVPGNAAEMAGLHAAGAFGFKAFLADSGVEEFPPLEGAALREALEGAARLGTVLIAHAEAPGVLAAAPPAAGPRYRDYLASRPPRAEVAAVEELVALAGETGARVHVVHLSAAEALPVLRAAREAGVQVTAETCPHYLCLTAEQVGDGATEYKCAPPIRSAANRDALWAALADGTLRMIVSDHSPCTPALKQSRREGGAGDFGAAWGGISSLQLGLPAVWTEARRRGHTLDAVARWMAGEPARFAGLPAKGAIEVGRDADLVAFAPERTFTVEGARLRHRHPITPYAGSTLSGVVARTWLRGTEVWRAGGAAVEVPTGRLLRSA